MSNRATKRPWTWLGLGVCLLMALLACQPGGPTGNGDADGDQADDGGDTAPQTATFIRQEIHSLTSAEIDAFRQGVALMQSRADDDPTSWTYQANIHGFPTSSFICAVTPGAPQPAWETCQHGNFFFLSWHRMYLYYFERILRAAVREAVGDPDYDFSLPYWDYENPSFHALPEPFRVPADGSNSLYVSRRAANCNNGQTCVSAQTADAQVALATIPFCNCPQGQTCTGCTAGLFPDEAFGSQFTPVPVHSAGNFGALESQPHNVVHTAVGGNFGWMSYVECAARDPIFWLHHANIDRLWQVWLNQGGGRQNPLGADNWRTQEFEFFDADGTSQMLDGCEILNMVTQLDYEYEGLPVENVVLCDDGGVPAGAAAAGGGGAPAETRTLAATRDAAVSLGNEPTRVSVDVGDDAAASMRSAIAGEATEPKELRLVIEGLKLRHPGAFYRVYINLPEGQEPDPESAHFVGNVALFGTVKHDGEGTTRTFDITENIRQLEESGHWEGNLEVTFVRGNPPPEDAEVPEGLTAPQELLTFSKVSVVER